VRSERAWLRRLPPRQRDHLCRRTRRRNRKTNRKRKTKTKRKKINHPARNLFKLERCGAAIRSTDDDANLCGRRFFLIQPRTWASLAAVMKVVDPRFNLQSDKLTVFITKDKTRAWRKPVAEGNVGLVRERPDPKGGPPTRAVGDPIKPLIQLLPAMLNWWEHRGCKRDRTCTWQLVRYGHGRQSE